MNFQLTEIFIAYFVFSIILFVLLRYDQILEGYKELSFVYFKKKNGLLKGCITFVILFFLIQIVSLLFPIYLIAERIYKIISEKKIKRNINYSYKYIPIYDYLFFKKAGRNPEVSISNISVIENKFNELDLIIFPIIFNYNSETVNYLNLKIRQEFEKKKIGLLIFDSLNVETNNNNLNKFDLLSNQNFSFKVKFPDINAAAFSKILGLEIENENKVICFKQSDPNTIYISRLSEFNINEEIILNNLNWTRLVIAKEQNIYILIAEYLSLKWCNSRKSEYSSLKLVAEKIRRNLYDRFSLLEEFDAFNLFKIVEYQTPQVLYQLAPKSNLENQISEPKIVYYREANQIQPINEESHGQTAKEDYKKPLNEIEVFQILSKMESSDKFDFRSKVFLKSSNLIYKLYPKDELDYSALTIGYTKFFEREINLSIVQLIRSNLGIPMPQNYDKYYYSNNEFSVNAGEGFKVNFNMKDKIKGTYLPPGLGQSIICIKRVNYLAEFRKIDLFIIKGNRINSIRNKAAHQELILLKDALEVRRNLTDLYILGVFDDLTLLKKKLSSD